MKYSAIHSKFLVSAEEITLFALSMRRAMAVARQGLGVTLNSRDEPKHRDHIDFIEGSIISAAESIGVDLGSKHGWQIDLSDCITEQQ